MYYTKTTKDLGTIIKTTADFRDFDNVKIVPLEVTLKYKKPSNEIITEIISNDNGFAHSVILDEPGTWNFRWECSGDFATSSEFDVFVRDTIVKL